MELACSGPRGLLQSYTSVQQRNHPPGREFVPKWLSVRRVQVSTPLHLSRSDCRIGPSLNCPLRRFVSTQCVVKRDQGPPVPLQVPLAQNQPFGTNPYKVLPAGGLKPALLLRSCFRYFSLSLQSAWHISIALLVLYRSDRVYRCALRDTPKTQATVPSSPTQEEAARDSLVEGEVLSQEAESP